MSDDRPRARRSSSPLVADRGPRARTTSSWPAACSAVIVDRAGRRRPRRHRRVTRADLPAARRARPDPRPLHPRGVAAPASSGRCARPSTSAGPSAPTVTVKTTPSVEGERRVEGTLAAADDDGVTVRVATTPASARSPTTRSSGPAPCSSGAPPRSPASRRSRPEANGRKHPRDEELRLHGGARGARRREGHLGRHAARRAGRRPRVGLQAHARRATRTPGSRSTPTPARSASTPRSSTRTASPTATSWTTRPTTSAASPPRPPSR